MNLKRPLAIVAVVELLYWLGTRLVLHYYPMYSIEAESLRTALRILSAYLDWKLLQPVILSRKANNSKLREPLFIVGLLYFLSIPILIGNCKLSTPISTLFILASLPVGLKEEFLFRGIVQNLMAEKYGALKAVLLTSILFTAWHIGVVSPTFIGFSQIFLASILLGIIYANTGSIIAVIFIHTIYDAVFVTPQLNLSLSENLGYIPMLVSIVLISSWASKTVQWPNIHSLLKP